MTTLRKFLRYRLDTALRALRDKPYDEWRITFEPSGFTLFYFSVRSFTAPTETQRTVSWDQVSRVIAMKSDHFTWDTIWLRFELTDGSTCSIPEEATGWNQLLEELSIHLPNAPNKSEWWPGVAQPAFASNVTQLYPAPT